MNERYCSNGIYSVANDQTIFKQWNLSFNKRIDMVRSNVESKVKKCTLTDHCYVEGMNEFETTKKNN